MKEKNVYLLELMLSLLGATPEEFPFDFRLFVDDVDCGCGVYASADA